MAIKWVRCVQLACLAVVVAGGCDLMKPHSPGVYVLDQLPAGPQLAAPGGLASSAIEAAGGLDAWRRTSKIELDAVVTVYEDGDTYYLTEHRYEIYPWSDSIRVSAAEPKGEFLWELAGGKYRMIGGSESLDVSPLAGGYRDFAEAVLKITTAPARLLDAFATYTPRGQVARVQGRDYQTIEVTYGARQISLIEGDEEAVETVEPRWVRGAFFYNQGTSLVDMIWLARPEDNQVLVVRGYDYKSVGSAGLMLPRKIEVFGGGPKGTIGPQQVKIDIQ